MTEPHTITVEHLRQLLAADAPDAILGLVGGAVEVLEPGQRDDEQHRGALEVVSRSALTERLGDDPGDEQLAAEAEALATSVQQLGG
ncbi:hypothetical protein [Aeromicrobium sp. NPDC092404]|uniref:hypothetical protein n=1 Tax=Aeromicrobium sp. NPDC092404 TaxID=3154976 RepID=UPI00341532C6